MIRINGLNVGGIRSYIIYPQLGSEGCSDLIAIKGEITLFLEIKSPTGVLEKSQIRFSKWCKLMGIKYHVVRSTYEISMIIGDEE